MPAIDVNKMIPLTWVLNTYGHNPTLPPPWSPDPGPPADNFRQIPSDQNYRLIAMSASCRKVNINTPPTTRNLTIKGFDSGGTELFEQTVDVPILETVYNNFRGQTDFDSDTRALREGLVLDDLYDVTMPAGSYVGFFVEKSMSGVPDQIWMEDVEITLWIEPFDIDDDDITETLPVPSVGGYETITWRLDSLFPGEGNRPQWYLDSLRLVPTNKRVIGIGISAEKYPESVTGWLGLGFGTEAWINQTIYAPIRVMAGRENGSGYFISSGFANEYIPAMSSVGLMQLPQGDGSAYTEMAEGIEITLFLENVASIPSVNTGLVWLEWNVASIVSSPSQSHGGARGFPFEVEIEGASLSVGSVDPGDAMNFALISELTGIITTWPTFTVAGESEYVVIKKDISDFVKTTLARGELITFHNSTTPLNTAYNVQAMLWGRRV